MVFIRESIIQSLVPSKPSVDVKDQREREACAFFHQRDLTTRFRVPMRVALYVHLMLKRHLAYLALEMGSFFTVRQAFLLEVLRQVARCIEMGTGKTPGH